VNGVGGSSSEEEDEKEKHVRNLVQFVQHRGELSRVISSYVVSD